MVKVKRLCFVGLLPFSWAILFKSFFFSPRIHFILIGRLSKTSEAELQRGQETTPGIYLRLEGGRGPAELGEEDLWELGEFKGAHFWAFFELRSLLYLEAKCSGDER